VGEKRRGGIGSAGAIFSEIHYMLKRKGRKKGGFLGEVVFGRSEKWAPVQNTPPSPDC